MRPTLLALSLLLAVGCACASGEHRGRDLASRGMQLIARAGFSEEERRWGPAWSSGGYRRERLRSRGWHLVAGGLAVLLSRPGEWGKDDATLRGDIGWFLTHCGRAARLPGEYKVGIKDIDLKRARRGDCDAILLTTGWYPQHPGPGGPAAQILIACAGHRTIAGGWRQEVGRGMSRVVCQWREGKLAAWTSAGGVWAVIAGYKTGGGTGAWPSAIILRSRGNGWRVVNRFDFERGDKNSFGLQDLDGDGIPEIVGNIYGYDYPYWQRDRRTPHEYVVYKLVRGSYRKIWYASTLPSSQSRQHR